jgi:hypothetical protein
VPIWPPPTTRLSMPASFHSGAPMAWSAERAGPRRAVVSAATASGSAKQTHCYDLAPEGGRSSRPHCSYGCGSRSCRMDHDKNRLRFPPPLPLVQRSDSTQDLCDMSILQRCVITLFSTSLYFSDPIDLDDAHVARCRRGRRGGGGLTGWASWRSSRTRARASPPRSCMRLTACCRCRRARSPPAAAFPLNVS